MAEVKRVPKWIMLEALENNVLSLSLETSEGTFMGVVGLSPTDFQEIAQGIDEPFLRVAQTQTLQVDVGVTIMAILLSFTDISTNTNYAADEMSIRYPIGGVDGETFPDGGSIEVTEFEVYLNDL